jgi:hypothetical protein
MLHHEVSNSFKIYYVVFATGLVSIDKTEILQKALLLDDVMLINVKETQVYCKCIC